jgi:hypothetical protein
MPWDIHSGAFFRRCFNNYFNRLSQIPDEERRGICLVKKQLKNTIVMLVKSSFCKRNLQDRCLCCN